MSAGKGEEDRKWFCCAVKQTAATADSPTVSGGAGGGGGRGVAAPEKGTLKGRGAVGMQESGRQKQVFRVKNLKGLPPNLNYLLSLFTSQDMTTTQNNATTYRV